MHLDGWLLGVRELHERRAPWNPCISALSSGKQGTIDKPIKNDFKKTLIAAVNHNGDSDSTGAITGDILGAYLGINAIPN